MMSERGIKRTCRPVWLLCAFVVFALVAALAVPDGQAFAATPAPTLGTLSLTQHDPDWPNSAPIPGGHVEVYQVGRIQNDTYVYVSPFDTLNDDLAAHVEQVDTDYLARLASLASSGGTPVATGEVENNGKAVFRGLEPGAYLVVETQPAPGYNLFDPFLVTIPLDGKYDVDASPKMDPVTSSGSSEEPPSNTTETPQGGTTSNGDTTPNGGTTPASLKTLGEKLPQTGQLWWPVWVLLAAGITLLVVGRVQKSGKHGA